MSYDVLREIVAENRLAAATPEPEWDPWRQDPDDKPRQTSPETWPNRQQPDQPEPGQATARREQWG